LIESNQLLINLSFLLDKPTGTTTYALNLLPHLRFLVPTLLLSKPIPSYNHHGVPPNQTAEQGAKGHLRRLIWAQRQLPRIYKQRQANLLFSPIPEAPLYTNCRYIVTVHDLIPMRFPKRFSALTSYYRYYVPQVLAQAQHILCDSKATAEDITDFFGISGAKITPILLAHDASQFRFLNLPMSNYFLYIGRHDPYKNLHRLIEAFAAVPNVVDYELWIAGPTDKRYTPTLQAQVNELGLKNQVKFLDYVPYDQLPIIINQSIALVFPSLWEGFGLPVLEAMACGTPVITSNLSSLPEVAGDAAILINPYNTGEITEAMQAVATDSNLRSRLHLLSLNRASQFSWEKTGTATAKVLQQYL
jgi:glycosyltransferase involved in cell wall biosynthesis